MQFTKLKIQGFKTFVEPAEVNIRQGLTGVVGPNGCGKSNLVEAIRWVMGENSYKNMRASGMEDVIFSGSGKRPSRNSAEVILTIDNSKRLAPVWINDADMLEISRKIERDAGSTYRINGKEVRARDVQLLFADASTGSRSPALVRQGQISDIINAKPQSRRKILEEAAGISGLHARRHEAETRLKSAEINLERLTDILAQIASNVETLREQAKGAIQYRELTHKIKIHEATLAWGKYAESVRQLQEAEKNLHAEEANVEGITLEQSNSVTQQAVYAAKLPALRDDAAKTGAALNRLINARDQLDGEEKRIATRSSQIRTQISQVESDIVRENSILNDAAHVLATLISESEILANEAGSSLSTEQNLHAKVKAQEANVLNHESAFNAATTVLAESTAKRNALERGLRESKERYERIATQIEELEYEEAKLALSSNDENELNKRHLALETALEKQKGAEIVTLKIEEANKIAKANADDFRRPLNEAERLAQRLETEVKTLQKLLNPIVAGKRFQPVIEEIIAHKGYETALAVALGEDLDAPLDPTSPLHWRLVVGEDASLPEGLSPLTDFVSAPAQLTRRLSQIGVVKREEGASLVRFLKTGQRLVSLQGDFWRWDGLTLAANTPTAAARRLLEKNRLTDLEQEWINANEAFKILKIQADKAFSESRDLAIQEQKSRDEWRTASRQVDIAREMFSSFERSLTASTNKREALAQTRLRLTETKTAAYDDLNKAQNMHKTSPELGVLELALTTTRQEVIIARSLLAEIRAQSQGVEREAQARAQRLKAIEHEKSSWTLRREKTTERIEDLTARAKEAQTELHTLMDAPEAIEKQRRALITAVKEAEAKQKQAADSLLEGEKAVTLADRAANDAMKAFSAARESLARAESKVEAQKQRRIELESAIEEQFDCAPNALVALANLDIAKPLPDSRKIEGELEFLKKEREKLGGVNLRADIELEEKEAKLNSLLKEQEDLLEAIKKLRGAITSLNREGRERLLASFEIVNTNFKRLFVQLFGGGTADLQLIESDDPLEAGLDILAMPLGKKPQTISLLSGGEQALTAIALIFAVFLTNPAPICVLDEVDAPLDDANVERYCDLLDEMVIESQTRFLVITHNPITMARMNRLFGVTMAERGVSQLVSVDLQKAEMLLNAA